MRYIMSNNLQLPGRSLVRRNEGEKDHEEDT